MNYIETNLQPGEEIKYVAKLHFFLFMQPVILLLIGAFLLTAPKDVLPVIYYAGLLMLFFGLVSLVQRILVKIGSAYAVTNKRVVLKTGVISRRSRFGAGKVRRSAYKPKYLRQDIRLRHNYSYYGWGCKFLSVYR